MLATIVLRMSAYYHVLRGGDGKAEGVSLSWRRRASSIDQDLFFLHGKLEIRATYLVRKCHVVVRLSRC
jgi:hypothetical protein